MQISQKKKGLFQKSVLDYYHVHGRAHLPWRKKITPYHVWVSEIMLQQTQVDRVIPFFNNWIKQFPTVRSLASAPQLDILRAWKGLGYNSRALRMKKTAQIICEHYRGVFPKTYDELLQLPGIGPYTAGAVVAFAYNQAVTIIETNIRRVYLHYFFQDQTNIHDRELLQIIEQTVDPENSRRWYWALMDYGAHLGKIIPNPNKKSRHYTVQKKFKGSDREIRGKILSILLKKKKNSLEKITELLQALTKDPERVERVVGGLEQEGFLEIKNGNIALKK